MASYRSSESRAASVSVVFKSLLPMTVQEIMNNDVKLVESVLLTVASGTSSILPLLDQLPVARYSSGSNDENVSTSRRNNRCAHKFRVDK